MRECLTTPLPNASILSTTCTAAPCPIPTAGSRTRTTRGPWSGAALRTTSWPANATSGLDAMPSRSASKSSWEPARCPRPTSAASGPSSPGASPASSSQSCSYAAPAASRACSSIPSPAIPVASPRLTRGSRRRRAISWPTSTPSAGPRSPCSPSWIPRPVTTSTASSTAAATHPSRGCPVARTSTTCAASLRSCSRNPSSNSTGACTCIVSVTTPAMTSSSSVPE